MDRVGGILVSILLTSILFRVFLLRIFLFRIEEFFDSKGFVGEDTNFPRDFHSFFRDLVSRQIGVFDQGSTSGQRIGTSAADRGYASIGLDHVSRAANEEGLGQIAYEQQSFQVAEYFI